MKLRCLQANLRHGLALIERVIAPKSTLPVLSNVLISAENGRLNLAATDLELGASCWIGAKVEADGATTVPATLLSDLVTSFPDQPIDLELHASTQTLQLRCDRTTTTLQGIEAEEFPTLPNLDDQHASATIPAHILRDAITQVAFAAATDDARPILCGVLVQLYASQARFTATNGFRLATCSIPIPETTAPSSDLIVPARALRELLRSIRSDDVTLRVAPSGGHIVFQTEAYTLISRLIDGHYVDVARLIPQQIATRAVLATPTFAQTVKQTAYVAASAAYAARLTLTPNERDQPGNVALNATAEIGSYESMVDGLVDGTGGSVTLNVRYLAEALQAIRSPQTVLETQAQSGPVVIRPVGSDDALHLIMPMHIR